MSRNPKRAALDLIDRAFGALPYLSHSWSDVRSKLYDMNEASEKQHRKLKPAGLKAGLTVAQAAKLFTVRHLAESLERPDKWSVDDVLSVRLECLYAQAYVGLYGDKIAAAWEAAGIDPAELRALDYAALIEG